MTYVTEQTSAELRAHMRRLQAIPGWHNPLDDRLFQEILALDVELDALREDAKDAARYRFLRDHAKAADMEYFGYQQAPGAFDAAIDEAMALHPGKDAGSGEGCNG